ncbi:MAG TPA: cation:proton antiporter [Bdellovibrionota bacterium]|nr:cation:proton antiporter [Bdellovibrionota bacterium]
MGLPFLGELLVLTGVGVLATLLVARFRLPAVAGLLLAGAVVGPHGLGLVADIEGTKKLAEVGVALLLFTIGLEFSLASFARIGRLLILGGSLQVGLTILGVMAIFWFTGHSVTRGIFFGFLVALSSTAIVLRGLSERRELDAPHGRFIMGTLIFQDLCVVPMMLVLPVLSGSGANGTFTAMATALAKAAALVIAVGFLARTIVPKLFAHVDALRVREIFLLSVLAVSSGTIYVTSLAGLSYALGALLAGMIFSESEYAHRAMTEVLPLRDVFSSLFFMSVGMLFDGHVLHEYPAEVILVFLGLFVGKGLIATVSCMAMRFPAWVAWLSGVSLAQFSEFGFVLASTGMSLGLMTAGESRIFFAAGIFSMFITPLAIRVAPHVTAGMNLLRPLERLMGVRGIDEVHRKEKNLKDHIVVAGYGLGGQIVTDALRESKISHVAIDLNSDTVRLARAGGRPVYYGDATSEETLRHAGVEHARALVLLLNDATSNRRVIAAAKRVAPNTPVFARTHYVSERPSLKDLGASDVVFEELEAGVEMMARVLRHMGIPRNILSERVREIRQKTQLSARKTTFASQPLSAFRELEKIKVETYEIRASDCANGKSAIQIGLRQKTGAFVIAVQRAGDVAELPNGDFVLRQGDVVYLAGARASISNAFSVLESGEVESTA